ARPHLAASLRRAVRCSRAAPVPMTFSAEERLANDPTSELWGEHRSRYRFAAQFAAGQRVLDVASGAGFGLQMLRQANGWPLGLDYDAAALREVRRVEPAAHLVHADATRLPLATHSLDLV